MITVTDIHKRFGETEVLRGVSLSVERGEVSVLLGPSGGDKFNAGRVAESGPPEQIFENPRQEVTRAFLAEAKSN